MLFNVFVHAALEDASADIKNSSDSNSLSSNTTTKDSVVGTPKKSPRKTAQKKPVALFDDFDDLGMNREGDATSLEAQKLCFPNAVKNESASSVKQVTTVDLPLDMNNVSTDNKKSPTGSLKVSITTTEITPSRDSPPGVFVIGDPKPNIVESYATVNIQLPDSPTTVSAYQTPTGHVPNPLNVETVVDKEQSLDTAATVCENNIDAMPPAIKDCVRKSADKNTCTAQSSLTPVVILSAPETGIADHSEKPSSMLHEPDISVSHNREKETASAMSTTGNKDFGTVISHSSNEQRYNSEVDQQSNDCPRLSTSHSSTDQKPTDSKARGAAETARVGSDVACFEGKQVTEDLNGSGKKVRVPS